MTRSRQNLAGSPLIEQWFPVTLDRSNMDPLLVGSPFLSEGAPHGYIVSAQAHAGMPYIAGQGTLAATGSTAFGGTGLVRTPCPRRDERVQRGAFSFQPVEALRSREENRNPVTQPPRQMGFGAIVGDSLQAIVIAVYESGRG